MVNESKKIWQGVPDKLVIALIQPLSVLDVTINIPAPVIVTVANLRDNKGVRCTDWEPWSLTPSTHILIPMPALVPWLLRLEGQTETKLLCLLASEVNRSTTPLSNLRRCQ